MPTQRATPWLAYLCLGASMAIVGGYVGLSKLLVAVFPVFLLAWLRFGIAIVAMLGWLRRDGGAARLGARTHALLFVESFFGNFLFSICMLFGIALSSALAAGVIMAAIPAAVAVLSRVLLHERIAPKVALGIAFAVGGIALVSLTGASGASQATSSVAGDLLLCGAVCCEAIYVVIGKRLTNDLGPKRISALINLWGFALVAPFGIRQAMAFDFAAVTVGSWALLGGYAIAASTVTVWLWMTGLARVDAARAGTFAVLLPISAALVGVVFLDEHIDAAQAIAFALALVGLVLATWPERPSPSLSP